jgi:hypothetical protein
LTAPLTPPFWLAAGRLELLLGLRDPPLRLEVLRLVLRVLDAGFRLPPDAFARPLVDLDALPEEARFALPAFEREPLDAVRLRCVLAELVFGVAILSSPVENVLLR